MTCLVPATPLQLEKRFAVTLAVIGLTLIAAAWSCPEWRLLATEAKLRAADYARWGSWWAAVGNGVVALGLAVTVRLWAGRELPMVDEPCRVPRHFWWTLAIILLTAVAVRWPRMNLGLYNDEAYNHRRYTVGEFKEGKLQLVKWSQTVWGNQMGNNGPLYSIASRACYAATVALSGGKLVPPQPSECALRVPSLIGGVASLFVIALIGLRLAGPRTGMAAAFLGALHPWHVRYSTEARAYGMVLLFSALALLAMIHAVRTGRWRWWLVLALSEFLLMWSFAGAIYFCAGLNLAALVGRWRQDGLRWRRLLVANVFAGMLYLQLFLPCVPQIKQAMATYPIFRMGVGAHWLIEAPSYAIFGLAWNDDDPGNPANLTLSRLIAEAPALTSVASFFLVLAGALGVLRLRRLGGGSILSLGTLLAFGLAFLISAFTRSVLLSWYVIYLVPAVMVMIGCGLAGVTLRLQHRLAGERISALATFFAAFAALGFYGRGLGVVMTHGKGACREAVRTMQAEPQSIKVALTALTNANVYDPSVISIDGDDELQALMAQAHREHRSLYVTYGHAAEAADTHGPIMTILHDSGTFDLVRSIPGLEESQFTHWVWRWNGRFK
jgi:Dolichyl-phosphate-mannose-protein mannosyltransferase